MDEARGSASGAGTDLIKYQRIIKDLYIDQDKTLDEVVHTMRQDHKFHARYDMINTRQRSND